MHPPTQPLLSYASRLVIAVLATPYTPLYTAPSYKSHGAEVQHHIDLESNAAERFGQYYFRYVQGQTNRSDYTGCTFVEFVTGRQLTPNLDRHCDPNNLGSGMPYLITDKMGEAVQGVLGVDRPNQCLAMGALAEDTPTPLPYIMPARAMIELWCGSDICTPLPAPAP